MPVASHHGLDTVYQSLQFNNPTKAEELRSDFETAAIYGLLEDKEPAKEAVGRLRRAALDMPPVFARVLNHTLDDLFGRNA